MRMRFILFVFSLLPFFAVAQTGAIAGKIVAGNQALPYATISLKGTSLGAITDENGSYTLSGVPAGNYEAHFSAVGYEAVDRGIKISADVKTTLNIDLNKTDTRLNEVIVTGVARGTRLRSNPIAVAVLSAKALTSQANTNIIDAIVKGIPGVSAVTTGPNISKPFIRGLGYNRVLTLYDGVRQEGQQWGDEHGIEIDQNAISRVEVVKGPASLTYGSDALAGVINLIPLIPDSISNRLYGSVVGEGHSNNGLMGTSLGLNYKKNDWKYGFRTSIKQAHDYRNSVDGFVYNTGFKEYNIMAMTRLDKAWGNITLAGNLYDNRQEIPDGSRDSLSRRFTRQVFEGSLDDIKARPTVSNDELHSYTIAPLYQRIQHYRLYTHGFIKTGENSGIDALLAFQQSGRREFNHPTAPAQPGLYVVLNTINYDLKYNLPPLSGWETTLGVNGMYQTNRNKNGTAFPIPDHELFDIGTFVLIKKKIGDFNISGGLRYDTRHFTWDDFYVGINPATGFEYRSSAADNSAKLQFPSFDKVYHGISGSAGITYDVSERVTLKANIARGYRAPNITEVGSNGLDPGAHIVYLGNRSFEPEFSLQQDFGVLAYLKDVDIAAEVFNNQISNYIYQSKLTDAAGNPVVIVPGNSTYQYQQAQARLYGAELSVNLHPQQLKWLNFNNSASYVAGIKKGSNGTGDLNLPLIPPLQIRSEIKFTATKTIGILNSPYLKMGINAYAAQNRFYSEDDTETATAGYWLANIGAGTTIKNKRNKTLCDIVINVDNLFDKAYQAHLNRLKYFEYYQHSTSGYNGIYNMGRNISFRVMVPF